MLLVDRRRAGKQCQLWGLACHTGQRQIVKPAFEGGFNFEVLSALPAASVGLNVWLIESVVQVEFKPNMHGGGRDAR